MSACIYNIFTCLEPTAASQLASWRRERALRSHRGKVITAACHTRAVGFSTTAHKCSTVIHLYMKHPLTNGRALYHVLFLIPVRSHMNVLVPDGCLNSVPSFTLFPIYKT